MDFCPIFYFIFFCFKLFFCKMCWVGFDYFFVLDVTKGLKFIGCLRDVLRDFFDIWNAGTLLMEGRTLKL